MKNKKIDQAKDKQNNIFFETSSFLEAIASPVRLKIIHLLTQSPHSVEQLAIKLDQSVANTSMHLNKMQRENILKIQQVAQKRIYSIAFHEMKDFWEQIQNHCQIHKPETKLSTAEIYGDDLSWDKNVEETAKLIRSKKIIVLDVRPEDESLHSNESSSYKKYILSLPFSELKKRKKEIPQKKPILVICRGRLCALAHESTFQLRKMGFDAYQLSSSWFSLSKLLVTDNNILKF